MRIFMDFKNPSKARILKPKDVRVWSLTDLENVGSYINEFIVISD